MGISQLSKVTILVARIELEELVSKLYEFEEFHPSEETPFTDEFSLVKLKSKAFDLYSELNNIICRLERIYDYRLYIESSTKVILKSTNWGALLGQIANEKDRINAKLSCKMKLYKSDLVSLLALREAALTTFNVLRRIRIKHELKYAIVLEGYIPTKSEEKFKEQFSKWYYIITPVRKDEKAAPFVPTLLTNPKFMKLFEEITITQGIPKYTEIDPTPLVAFVFPIFYGIMFPDLGQGMLMILLGKLLSIQGKKGRGRRDYRYWGKMMMVFGISADSNENTCGPVGIRNIFDVILGPSWLI